MTKGAMIRRGAIAVLLVATTALSPLPEALRPSTGSGDVPPGPRPRAVLRVFFVGNSLTLFHDLPRTVELLASGAPSGARVVTESEASMFRYGKLFDEEIERSGARTLLYVQWANVGAPAMLPALEASYARLAGEIGGRVVPVGAAWKLATTRHAKRLPVRPRRTLFGIRSASPIWITVAVCSSPPSPGDSAAR